jgi:hypothetical protein
MSKTQKQVRAVQRESNNHEVLSAISAIKSTRTRTFKRRVNGRRSEASWAGGTAGFG